MRKIARTRAEALFAATQKKACEPAGAAKPDGHPSIGARAEMQPVKARVRRIPERRVLHLANQAASLSKAGSAGTPNDLIAKRSTLRLPQVLIHG